MFSGTMTGTSLVLGEYIVFVPERYIFFPLLVISRLTGRGEASLGNGIGEYVRPEVSTYRG